MQAVAPVPQRGAGTAQSTLLAGRPSVVVAHVSDQEFWGSELERLGVGGPTLRRRGLRAGPLAASIRLVAAAPRMADWAAEIGAKMSDEQGVSTAVRLIEESLR